MIDFHRYPKYSQCGQCGELIYLTKPDSPWLKPLPGMSDQRDCPAVSNENGGPFLPHQPGKVIHPPTETCGRCSGLLVLRCSGCEHGGTWLEPIGDGQLKCSYCGLVMLAMCACEPLEYEPPARPVVTPVIPIRGKS